LTSFRLGNEYKNEMRFKISRTKSAFIYVDPTYLPSTRKKYLYWQEIKDADHTKLLSLLQEHPEKIFLSGYDNKLFNKIMQG